MIDDDDDTRVEYVDGLCLAFVDGRFIGAFPEWRDAESAIEKEEGA
jgi:hypothetical protein